MVHNAAWLCAAVLGSAMLFACSSSSTNSSSKGGGGISSGGSKGGAPNGGGGSGGSVGGTAGSTAGAAGASGGGAAGAPACDASADFAGIMEVTELNHGAPNGDLFARLSSNEKEVYFNRFGTSFDLWSASRSNTSDTDAFTSIKPLGFNSEQTDGAPTVTDSNLVLYFSSNRAGTSHSIYAATRPSIAVDFQLKTVPVIDGGTTISYLNPYILPDGTAMYLVGGTGGTTYDIYRAENKGGVVFDAPFKVATVNDPNVSDGAPIVSADDKTLFFTSRRAGDASMDIYFATRNDAQKEAFGMPKKVPGLNTDGTQDLPSWISPDGCRIYFFRQDANNVNRIYRAKRGG